jgi:hypothetical protein
MLTNTSPPKQIVWPFFQGCGLALAISLGWVAAYAFLAEWHGIGDWLIEHIDHSVFTEYKPWIVISPIAVVDLGLLLWFFLRKRRHLFWGLLVGFIFSGLVMTELFFLMLMSGMRGCCQG